MTCFKQSTDCEDLRNMRLSPKRLWRTGFFIIETMRTGALIVYMDVGT
jgi:hypothetical protein